MYLALYWLACKLHIASDDVYYWQVRDPMPAIFFFVIDVSMNAVQTGATAAACSAISQVISDLPVSVTFSFLIFIFYFLFSST